MNAKHTKQRTHKVDREKHINEPSLASKFKENPCIQAY